MNPRDAYIYIIQQASTEGTIGRLPRIDKHNIFARTKKENRPHRILLPYCTYTRAIAYDVYIFINLYVHNQDKSIDIYLCMWKQ